MKVSIDQLEHAIALIKQGKPSEAQDLLKSVLTADHHNLSAWFWFVKTYSTNEERLKALELCLKYNPDNDQVKQAIDKFRSITNQQPSINSDKHEVNPSETARKPALSIFSTITYTIIYFIVIAGFIAEIRFAIDYYNSIAKGDGGFGLLAIFFFGIGALGVQWILICVIASFHMTKRKKQVSLTRWIWKTGQWVGIIFTFFPLLNGFIGLITGDFSVEYLLVLVLGSIQLAPFLFVFGFASGSGFATFLIFLLEIKELIIHLTLFLRKVS